MHMHVAHPPLQIPHLSDHHSRPRLVLDRVEDQRKPLDPVDQLCVIVPQFSQCLTHGGNEDYNESVIMPGGEPTDLCEFQYRDCEPADGLERREVRELAQALKTAEDADGICDRVRSPCAFSLWSIHAVWRHCWSQTEEDVVSTGFCCT